MSRRYVAFKIARSERYGVVDRRTRKFVSRSVCDSEPVAVILAAILNHEYQKWITENPELEPESQTIPFLLDRSDGIFSAEAPRKPTPEQAEAERKPLLFGDYIKSAPASEQALATRLRASAFASAK